MEEFDLVVVGAGSGLDVASAARSNDWRVAVVEKGPLGGTCLNRGCIPSKLLLAHADVAETVQEAGEYHVDADYRGADFERIVTEVNESVRESSESIEEAWADVAEQSSAGNRNGARSDDGDDYQLYEGAGRFVDDRTLEVAGYDEQVRGDQVLVAAGTRPTVPPIDGLDDTPHMTSREALELTDRPDSLVVVGGGYVGAELGHFFGTFGTDVTIVGRRPHLLPQTDPEVGAVFTDVYTRKHTVHVGYEATAVEETEDGVRVHAERFAEPAVGEAEAESVTVEADRLLVATGRTPNSDRLNLEATGVATDDHGFVETDEYMETTAADVYAIGDIVGEYLLKHNANREARAAARNIIWDAGEAMDYTAMPYGVFASPEVAGVGKTEDDLDEGYALRTYPYANTARGDAYKEEDGICKVLIDPDDRTILGCHIVGPEATTLVHEVVVAMKRAEGTVDDVREAVHVHPSTSEVVSRAFSGRFHRPDHGHDH